MGAVGAAVDYSRANSTRSAMQSSLDATTLMLAKNVQSLSSTQITQLANNYFTANFTSPELNNVATSATAAQVSAGITITGSASGTINTQIMKVMGFESMTITVRSVALAKSDGQGCVLSLNGSTSGATSVSGSTTVALNNCSLYDNSNNNSALTASGSSSLSALSVSVVGGATGTANISATQGIKTHTAPAFDPYANDTYPAPPANCQNQSPLHNTQTLSPGFFCGLKLNSDANVTLNPGIYYLGKRSEERRVGKECRL